MPATTPIFKLKGLPYYMVNAPYKSIATIAFVKARVGVISDNLEQVNKINSTNVERIYDFNNIKDNIQPFYTTV
jgi:hypothetical protein